MRWVASLTLAAAVAIPALAQSRAVFPGGARIGGREFGYGFGSVVFPGGMPARPGAITDPGFANRLGGIVTGFRPYTGAPTGGIRHPQTTPVAVPYPVFVGGYYPEYPPQQQPNVVVVQQPPAPAPQIIINQYLAPKPETSDSSVQVYQAPTPAAEAPPASQDPTIYLIAFNDGSIRTAIAYWMEGETLHYVTPGGRPNKASLELIDVAYSRRLNRERNVAFEWPLR